MGSPPGSLRPVFTSRAPYYTPYSPQARPRRPSERGCGMDRMRRSSTAFSPWNLECISSGIVKESIPRVEGNAREAMRIAKRQSVLQWKAKSNQTNFRQCNQEPALNRESFLVGLIFSSSQIIVIIIMCYYIILHVYIIYYLIYKNIYNFLCT